jgi:hypothetical protein
MPRNRLSLLFGLFPLILIGGFATASMSQVVIHEISPVGGGVLDEDEEWVDWFELKNTSPSSVSLLGWSVSDDPDEPKKWVLPGVSIPSGGFLLVFASGKNRAPVDGSNLHTNFELDSDGEFFALYSPNGSVRSVFSPGYPAVRDGFSYGFDPGSGQNRFLRPPTPGAENSVNEAYASFLPGTVDFSLPRGYYDEPISVDLSYMDMQVGTTIRFTTDSSAPGPTRGEVYSDPVPIAETTILRAVALQPGIGPTEVMTHTYLLNIAPHLRHLPALSIVSDEENFTGPNGIAHRDNVQERGRAWERPVSVEYIENGDNSGFQINGGIRLHGQASRSFAKKSYRLYFRSEYGPSRLDYPLMPDCELERFKKLVLRGGGQDLNPFFSDELARRLYLDCGQVAAHGTFVQLFRNGDSWAYYNPTEYYDEDFFEAWHGGDDQWDVVRHSGVEEGDGVAWNELLGLLNQDLSVAANYQAVEARLDVTNFVDYLLLYIFGAGDDWPGNNWTAAREVKEGAKFRFYPWDAEQSFGGEIRSSPVTDTISSKLAQGTSPIPRLYQALVANEEFRELFTIRYRKHFFEDGGLTDTNIMSRYLEYRRMLQGTIPGSIRATVSTLFVPGRRYHVDWMLSREGLLEPLDPLARSAPAQGPQLGPGAKVPAATLTADLVGDGFIDTLDLIEYRNREEAGRPVPTFRDESWERIEFPVEKGTHGLESVDVDRDGDEDLVTVNGDYGRVLAFLNQGGGLFGSPLVSSMPLGGAALVSGDLNSDSIPDLVITTDFMAEYSACTLIGDGQGNFSLSSQAPFNFTDQSRRLHPRTLALRDLDGDGNLDLIVQNEAAVLTGEPAITNHVSVLRNTGEGAFVASLELESGEVTVSKRHTTGTRALVTEDFDADGDTDFVTVGGEAFPVLIENQGGTFSTPLDLGAPQFSPLYSVDAADIDGDSDLDLAVCDRLPDRGNGIHFLTNQGGGVYQVAPGLNIEGNSPETLLFTDIDSDGDNDLVVLHYWPFLEERSLIEILANDGTGVFEQVAGLRTFDYEPFPKWIDAGDWDKDGDQDLAALDPYNGSLTLFLNQEAPSPPSADLNGDGSLDILDLLEIGSNWMDEIAP